MTHPDIDTLFSVGAHYGYSRSRRHPSTGKYIFGVKNNIEIFDLEKTQSQIASVLDFVEGLGASGKSILFVSGKAEGKQIIQTVHEKTKLPYVTGRWIGGTLTNFEGIHKRVERLVDIRKKQEEGGLEKYTKRERLLMRREADALEEKFGGLVDMEKLPDALFVIDSHKEELAVKEAQNIGVPVIALASSDCDISSISHPIPANDANIKSITFFVERVAESYMKGLAERSTKTKKEEPKKKAKVEKVEKEEK